jgi:hypothetical protein
MAFIIDLTPVLKRVFQRNVTASPRWCDIQVNKLFALLRLPMCEWFFEQFSKTLAIAPASGIFNASLRRAVRSAYGLFPRRL